VATERTAASRRRGPLGRSGALFGLVSLLIACTDALFVYINFVGDRVVLHENLARKGEQYRAAFELLLGTEVTHMQQVATYVANDSRVQDLFLRGKRAVEAEGGGKGGERAAALRAELYGLVASGWDRLTERYHIRQLHFHLGPGDTSFLRVHRSDRFGDDLTEVRHTIVDANRLKVPTGGFESGRVYAGIRGVVPVFARDPADGSRVHVGALEAGSAFDSLLAQLAEGTGAAFAVLMRKAHVDDTHWPDFARRLYARRPPVGGWFIESTTAEADAPAVIEDPAVHDRLSGHGTLLAQPLGGPLAVTVFPLRDYLGTRDPQRAPIGAVLAWSDATAEVRAFERGWRVNVAYGLAGFVLVESLLVAAWSFARRRFRRMVEAQTARLATANRKLEAYRTRLEDLVQERTRALREAVDDLGEEVNERRHIAAQLHREKERAQVTLASIGDGVISTDAQHRVQYLNPMAEALTGWPADEAAGRPIAEVLHLDEVSAVTGGPQALPGSRTRREPEGILLQRRDGQHIAVAHTRSPMRGPGGEEQGVVVVFHDVTQARELARRLSHQASHDALTGLVNRPEMERRLATALDAARMAGEGHAFLYLDLDQFKVVNDTCGHVAGDELLRQLGTVLRAHVRRHDTLARLGGDEFGVLLEGCPVQKATQIAEDLLESVQEFRFVWVDKTFAVGASIGVAALDADSESVAAVLSAADTACYMAKDLGRNRVHVYHPQDHEVSVRRGEMQWVSRIVAALEEDRLVLYRQPIVRTADATVMHHEVLVRMRDPAGELVPPNAFIPAAERYGLMPRIDRWVVRNVIERLARQGPRAARSGGLYAINLSGTSLGEDGFLDFVRRRLDAHGVAGERICFEVTETAAISNLSQAHRFMSALRERGCRFALDDFGSGLSSFAYLKNLPVDFLKVDGVFVRDLAHDPIDRVMVSAINQVGHAMGLQTIAEFVENDAILARLRNMGVDYAQGYGVGRPRPFDEEPARVGADEADGEDGRAATAGMRRSSAQ
jgi:diguanylate cyclase (GGDEF)-like protein/PAS domain S-box-containing protein